MDRHDGGGSQALRLEWAETGGPPVKTPGKRGFGSVVIHRGLEYELDGKVDIDFRRGGLVFEAVVPLAALAAGRDGAGNAG